MSKSFGMTILAGAAIAISLSAYAASAAEDETHIARQPWSFAGLRGSFDEAQLQRGFLVYKEVCSNCHGIKRLSFRTLAEPSGPEFPEDGVKSLAASYQIEDGPNDQGKLFKRPGRLSDYFPSPYRNEQEARATHNGALPPDLSVIIKARSAETEQPFYRVPFSMIRNIVSGYQEGGADYVYALMTGYVKPPDDVKVAEGMNYNIAFPGHQIAMINPFAGGDGMVKYTDGTPATVDNYARDITAFLAWVSDPKLEERKRMGLAVFLYLLVTSVLLYFAKKRVWERVAH
jgi:ubiquinol-cytochrome c reductase cytochrome c1 subunit